MLNRVAVRALNHVLERTPWAQRRLQPFAGRTARLEARPLRLTLSVSADGGIETAVGGGEPDVTIRLPDNAPLLWLTDRKAVFGSAHLAGAADFAEALAFVFRNIEWDLEADLAEVVGDLAAHRLTTTGQRVAAWQAATLRRVAANLGEYLLEEEAAVVRRAEVESFCGEVNRLRDDLVRLEKRLGRLLK